MHVAHLFIKLSSFCLNFVLLILTQTDVISIGVNNTNLGVVVSTYFFLFEFVVCFNYVLKIRIFDSQRTALWPPP